MSTLADKINELVKQRSQTVEDELILLCRWMGVDPFKDLQANTLTRFYCNGAEAFGYYTEHPISGSEWPHFRYEKKMVPLLEINEGEIIRHYSDLEPETVRATLMEWVC